MKSTILKALLLPIGLVALGECQPFVGRNVLFELHIGCRKHRWL
jgi:hypothetical protein